MVDVAIRRFNPVVKVFAAVVDAFTFTLHLVVELFEVLQGCQPTQVAFNIRSEQRQFIVQSLSSCTVHIHYGTIIFDFVLDL